MTADGVDVTVDRYGTDFRFTGPRTRDLSKSCRCSGRTPMAIGTARALRAAAPPADIGYLGGYGTFKFGETVTASLIVRAVEARATAAGKRVP